MKRKIICLMAMATTIAYMLTACVEYTDGAPLEMAEALRLVSDQTVETGISFQTFKIGHISIDFPDYWDIRQSSVMGGVRFDQVEVGSVAWVRPPTTDYANLFISYGGEDRERRELDAWGWIDHFVNSIYWENYDYVGQVVEIDGVEIAILMDQEFWRGRVEMRIPHNDRQYYVGIDYDDDNEAAVTIAARMLSSLSIASEPYQPRPPVAKPVETSGDVEGDTHTLGEMTIWIPTHWTFVTGEHNIYRDRGTTSVFFNPATDRAAPFHTSGSVSVSNDLLDWTVEQWFEVNTSFLEADLIEYGIRTFDGVDGVHLTRHPTSNDIDRIREWIVIPYNGMIYEISFNRCAVDKFELAIFGKMRDSIQFQVI